MKTVTVFENKMREANYASLSEARHGISVHPLTPEYIVDLLLARGIIRVTDEGAVVGCGSAGAAVARIDGVKPWDPKWAKKIRLLDLLDYDEDDGESRGIKMRSLQEHLKEDNEPHTHWVTLHALWNLIKEGLVEKLPSGYSLTKAEHDRRHKQWLANYKAMTDAFKAVGAPYDRDKMMAKLRSIPGHTNLDTDDAEEFWSQDTFTKFAEFRKDKGEL